MLSFQSLSLIPQLSVKNQIFFISSLKKKTDNLIIRESFKKNFGPAGFEPATPSPPDLYAKPLRYGPKHGLS